MSAFRCVEARDAGPAALGVLSPPGRRTYLILRPRAPWDLVLLQPGHSSVFHELDRDEATAAAAESPALEEWAAAAPAASKRPTHRRGRASGSMSTPGRSLCCCAPARPASRIRRRFGDAESAGAAVAELVSVLHPPAGAQQELYFNTRHFLR